MALGANAVNANLVLTPINDQAYEGDEIATANVAAGTGYTIGTASSISATVVDDDPPPGMVLFSDDFDTDSSALWKVNLADPANGSVIFAWDYSTVGVPAAPGGGGTKGMRMQCGNIIVSQDAVSASPLGKSFTGDYRLKFDMWINYNGPMPDGGPGSTQNFDAGVGTSGEGVVWLYSFPIPADGVWFSATGDGADYLSPTHTPGGDYNAMIGDAIQNDDTGCYAAGTAAPDSGIRDASHSFYSLMGRPGGSGSATGALSEPNGSGEYRQRGHGVAHGRDHESGRRGDLGDGRNHPCHGDQYYLALEHQRVRRLPGSVCQRRTPSDVPAMSFGLVDNLKVSLWPRPPTDHHGHPVDQRRHAGSD